MKSQKVIAIIFLMLLCSLSQSQSIANDSPHTNSDEIRSIMTKVADWQIVNPRHTLTNWANAALYTGLEALARMDDSEKYMLHLKSIGQQVSWQLASRKYHADDHAVGQLYLSLYVHFREPQMVGPTTERMDYILQNPSAVSLESSRQQGMYRYWWCDALFMAPPVWAKLSAQTGNMEYINYMNQEWWTATDYLYDPQERLYFRDDNFFDAREDNDAKIFWSRGNGWVLAGLARTLESMPQDYPDRGRYIELYREMAKRIIELQAPDGMWRSSLLYPERYPVPESSGTGFFTYALAWGVNRGYLDEKTYAPSIFKAWQSLVDCVHPNGKLGYVQRIAADPGDTSLDDTETYGVGAFLLAGSEVYKMALAQDMQTSLVHVTNPIPEFRDNETISLDFSALQAKNSSLTEDNAAVFDFRHKRFIVSQLVDSNADGTADQLLFQADMAPGQQRWFWVMPLPDGFDQPQSPYSAVAMHVPDRADDFSWENDRIGYRVYAKALEEDLRSSGVDPWVKRVRYPVVREFYDSQDYHRDHGKGLNYYLVGQSLGAGGTGILQDRQLYTSGNYRDWKIIANGPIRTIFELTYEPWDAGRVKLGHTMRVSLDLGSNLSRYEIHYHSDDSAQIRPAAGVITRQGEGDRRVPRGDQGWLVYWEPEEPINGTIGEAVGVTGVGIVFKPCHRVYYDFVEEHMLLFTQQSTDEPFIYYSGAGWDQSQDFDNVMDWQQYVRDFARQLANPLEIVCR